MDLINRSNSRSVALETTLLAHGLPAGVGAGFAHELLGICEAEGASPALIGVVGGRPIVGMDDAELNLLLEACGKPGGVAKASTSNLGALIFQGCHAATTVSTTVELAAAAGLRIFATGGLGGVHRNYALRPDISSDLAALARFPVAVVASGVKSILDIQATREVLETLGVPVIGYQTDLFPAFYLRQTELVVDARFDDAGQLAAFTAGELRRTGRGVLIVNPVPESDAIDPEQLEAWLREAEQRAGSVQGRQVTPAVLSHLHQISGGATLRANLALVRENVRLASQVCVRMSPQS
jgi:pseudouridylate synthase